MNAKMKRRLAVVTGVIIIVIVVVLAIVAGGTSAKSVSVAQAVSGQYVDTRVQVTGNVVKDSFTTENDILSFEIYDPDSQTGEQLAVQYDGVVAATFGNDVTAIVTGKINENGVLIASELVTKCPSKYESGTDAIDVSLLLESADNLQGTMLKVSGVVQSGSLVPAGSDVRFVLVSEDDPAQTVKVAFDGALPESVTDGAQVVVLGSLTSGVFEATEVSLKG